MATGKRSGQGKKEGGRRKSAASPASPASPTGELADLPFEKCLARLERIVENLESGEVPLEKGLAFYEEGVGLLRECHRKLDEAERKIQVLVRSGGGFKLKDFAGKARDEASEEDDEE